MSLTERFLPLQHTHRRSTFGECFHIYPKLSVAGLLLPRVERLPQPYMVIPQLADPENSGCVT